MADACVFLMNLPDDKYASLLGSDEAEDRNLRCRRWSISAWAKT
jgi:hypothetical protein